MLDYCAGGGGKALAVAGMADGVEVTAHDADPARMADLPARVGRAGAHITICDTPAGTFDLVITDVPCSGSGTWRRTPDAKWRSTREMLETVLKAQKSILENAADLVASGGSLAYMTCSLLEEENADQVDAFLADAPFTELARHRWSPLDASDGFFLSLMQRDA